MPMLWCDYADCDNEITGKDPDQSIADLRSSAKLVGWSHPMGADLCEEHTKAMTAGRRMRVVAGDGQDREVASGATTKGDDK